MKISAVEAICLREPDGPAWDRWCPSPMDALQQGARTAIVAPTGVSNVLVRVQTDEGLEGYGLVGIGSPASAVVIRHHLAPHVLGRSPFDVELIWESMFRSSVNMGRKGLVIEALSALDIAIWDVLGKALSQPVYNLIGGQVKREIRAYVSSAYAREDLDLLAEEVRGYAKQGYTALKMRFGYGPADGIHGKRLNEELVATVRDAAGPDVEVAADAYMGWDVNYTLDMIKRLEGYDLAWIEEPLMPDDYAGYARVRDASPIRISAGEHEFTRWGYLELLRRRCVDIVQPDVNRMGGITEALKVWALASAFNVPVVPHSHAAHNAHLIVSHLNSPLIEMFPATDGGRGYTLYAELFAGQPVANNGYVQLSEAPGFGLSLNEALVDELRVPGA